jgi:hypothetical protein
MHNMQQTLNDIFFFLIHSFEKVSGQNFYIYIACQHFIIESIILFVGYIFAVKNCDILVHKLISLINSMFKYF